jgi:hypothetical protein
METEGSLPHSQEPAACPEQSGTTALQISPSNCQSSKAQYWIMESPHYGQTGPEKCNLSKSSSRNKISCHEK